MWDIIIPLMNAGEYFVGYCLAISETVEYFVVNCFAISECWGNFLLAIDLPLLNVGEYLICYCLAIILRRRVFCWLLTCYY